MQSLIKQLQNIIFFFFAHLNNFPIHSNNKSKFQFPNTVLYDKSRKQRYIIIENVWKASIS